MRTLGIDPTTVGRRARVAKSLSLRKTIEKLAVRLAFLFYRRQKLAFVSIVKEKRQSCAATGFSIVLPLPQGFTSDSA